MIPLRSVPTPVIEPPRCRHMYAGNQIPPEQALQIWQDPNNLQRMAGEQERKSQGGTE